MSKTAKEVFDLREAVGTQLSALELINDYVGKLVMEAGAQKPHKSIELSYCELFNLSNALFTGVNNIKRVIGANY